MKDILNVIKPIPESVYRCDIPIGLLESYVERLKEHATFLHGELELNPDFQRGHVWKNQQQVKFVENYLRGLADATFLFNACGWMSSKKSENKGILCIDGLQRLTAIISFVNNEFKVFDRYYYDDLKTNVCANTRKTVKVQIYEIPTRKELLQFYYDLNNGGTPHTKKELDRVKSLLNAEK